MDNNLRGGAPAEGFHGQAVGAAIADGELLCKIIQKVNRVAGIKTLLIRTVAALHLAVVLRSIRTDQPMPDAKLGSSPLNQRRQRNR